MVFSIVDERRRVSGSLAIFLEGTTRCTFQRLTELADNTTVYKPRRRWVQTAMFGRRIHDNLGDLSRRDRPKRRKRAR